MSYGYSSKLSVGTIVSGEKHLELDPKYPPVNKKQGIAFVHGASYDALYCIGEFGLQGQLTNRIVGDGFCATSDDNGGPQTWGNDSAVTKIASAVTALQARPNAKAGAKVALVSTSMGFQNSLNYTLANPTKVSCLVSIIPVINVEDMRANNRGGVAAAINAAYSGTYSDAAVGATKNPYNYRANSLIANIPMLLFYGSTDALCLPTYTQQFAAAAPTMRTAIQVTGGHEDITYRNVDYNQILLFLNTYAI